VYGLFVINEAGETEASVGWENLEGDSALLGGFVSALQMFIKKISGNEVNEMQFGDLKLLIGRAKDDFVVTLHNADESDAKELNQEVSRLVAERDGEVDDGVLSLINEMLKGEAPAEEKEKVKKGMSGWTRSETSKAKDAAREWGRTVF
jgi:hypothetical protein